MPQSSRWFNLNNPYAVRDDNLRRLGFKTYRAYLCSALWKAIRARVLDVRAVCEHCRKQPSAQVHHRAYDPATLRGDQLDSLTAICKRCHRRAERPKDFGQDRYDRLMSASAYLTGRVHPRERELRRQRRPNLRTR